MELCSTLPQHKNVNPLTLEHVRKYPTYNNGKAYAMLRDRNGKRIQVSLENLV